MMVATPEKLEFRLFIPTTFCSGECKGEDAGSIEEIGAFFTTELADSECAGADDASGEDLGVEGDTASDALVRLHTGMSFVSKSMSSKYSSL